MMTHLGAGVNQGFEDAYVLYRLLTHPAMTRKNLSVGTLTLLLYSRSPSLQNALQLYTTLRVPRATSVWAASARMDENYNQYERSVGDNDGFVHGVKGIWEDIWQYDVDKVVDKAFEGAEWLQVDVEKVEEQP